MPPIPNAATEQKCVTAVRAVTFTASVNELIQQGWVVLPGTIAANDSGFVAVVQRSRTPEEMAALPGPKA